MIDQRCFVQFLHPGQEHGFDDPLAGIKYWNGGDHRRKYMAHTGRYVTELENRTENIGHIAFWGEWEPPSHVEMFPWSSERLLPHYIHRPILHKHDPSDAKELQNTDPYVFGNIFRYFVCRQYIGSSLRPTQLRNLLPGSVILFGSCVGREHFGLDTVFVVKDYLELIPDNDCGHFDELVRTNKEFIPDHYYDISLWTYRNFGSAVRLYRGVTIDDPVDGMFSFVPCSPFSMRREDEDDETDVPRLPRPAIEIEGVIANMQNQGYGLTGIRNVPDRYASGDSFRGLWEEVVRQVLGKGYALATSIDLPSADAGNGGDMERLLRNGGDMTAGDSSSTASFSCSPGNRTSDHVVALQDWSGMAFDDINTLARDVLTYYVDEVPNGPHAGVVVQPSLPILYFGNYDAYLEAGRRIVTVGVNPSFAEFRVDADKLPRFSLSDWDDTDSYRATLSSYFDVNPYRTWFDNGYEKVLNRLDASYYADNGVGRDRAVHTDLLSPLATAPIWSMLSPDCRGHFASAGNDFWHRLIDLLEPDVILASVARLQLVRGVRFRKSLVDKVDIKERAHNEARKNPYVLEKWKLTLSSGKVATLIWGRKQTMPFQDLGDAQKDEIRKFLDAEHPVATG